MFSFPQPQPSPNLQCLSTVPIPKPPTTQSYPVQVAMQTDPIPSLTERHRANPATHQQSVFLSDSSRSSTPSPSDSDSPSQEEYSSRLTTPRPEQDQTQSAAALALLGLSMRTSSEAPPTIKKEHPPSPAAIPLGGVSMKVTLSSASESANSSDSTGSTRMSSMKKRRSSDSSGQTEDTGRSKRTRGSEESNGSPPTPKAKTDGWSDEMKRVYEQAAFALPPSGREQRRLFGEMRGRNEQLGLWVTLEIGTYCGRKRISSHSQTLKNHHGTNPELKRFLTTDSSCNPTSPSDPTAWPLRLKQLVHAAYLSLPNPPSLPPVAELDLANMLIPAIPVRILRKDGIEVEMTLPDAIEYDKADQRMKNREKKPVRGRIVKKSRTATPIHSRGVPHLGPMGGRSPSGNYSPGPSNHARASSSNVHRDIDRQTRYRQYSHTNSDLPSHHNNFGHGPEVSGPTVRPIHPSSAPTYWDKSRSGRHVSPPHSHGHPYNHGHAHSSHSSHSHHSHHPPQSVAYPPPSPPHRNYPAQRRYDSEEEDEMEDPRNRQPHAPSLDFILAKPLPRPTPSPSPTAAASPVKRTFWKS